LLGLSGELGQALDLVVFRRAGPEVGVFRARWAP
jgi:hypothetical protein